MSWLPADFVHPVRVPVSGIGIHLRPIREADIAIDYPAGTIRPPGPARSSQSGMQLQLVQHLRAGVLRRHGNTSRKFPPHLPEVPAALTGRRARRARPYPPDLSRRPG
jgi:hypothetical protein